MSVYTDLQPAELWRHFGELNQIPRPSHQEAAAAAYVRRTAEAAGARWAADADGNTVVYVPASPGRENAPPVVIQAHLDMVCEQRPGVAHDFTRDPIRPQLQGDRLSASGTTLGADNGIGAAAALAALTQPGLEHGPLELLLTVEEETGLHGAMRLDPSLVRARLMINLDSEDPRELTVGCAGGAGTVLRLPASPAPAPEGWTGQEVVVSGLKGGHSGVQIHERLANAIKLLTRALLSARAAGVDFALAGIAGGNAHNAIPRDATARLAVAPEQVAALEAAVVASRADLQAEWGSDEPGLSLRVAGTPTPDCVLPPGTRDRLLTLLDGLPHGILAMSQAFPGKVETSSNLAQVSLRPGEPPVIEIGTSTRSFVAEELQAVQDRIRALGEAAGAEVVVRDGYPGWEPDPGSRLLAVTRAVFERELGVKPEVQVIHAGLECGVIVSKLPGMEAISFGPRIEGAHTPEECVYVSTVQTTWRLLTALLKALAA